MMELFVISAEKAYGGLILIMSLFLLSRSWPIIRLKGEYAYYSDGSIKAYWPEYYPFTPIAAIIFCATYPTNWMKMEAMPIVLGLSAAQFITYFSYHWFRERKIRKTSMINRDAEFQIFLIGYYHDGIEAALADENAWATMSSETVIAIRDRYKPLLADYPELEEDFEQYILKIVGVEAELKHDHTAKVIKELEKEFKKNPTTFIERMSVEKIRSFCLDAPNAEKLAPTMWQFMQAKLEKHESTQGKQTQTSGDLPF